MFNNGFFKHLSLLRKTHHKPTAFNLFNVLKSSSDEVGLHSRFLASMLNPNGSHQGGDKYLSRWLELVGVNDFELSGALVQTEYKNIDILIRNNAKQAIVIENKIYAEDQPQQLTRYYQAMKGEGVEDIYVIYLTLHGHEPSDDSIKGLSKAFIKSDHFLLISYELEIRDWILKCIEVDALNAPLRESLAQYLNLIEQLTGTEQSESYMTELKKLLQADDNLANFLDLKRAYTETLIDLQWSLWQEMLAYQRKKYPQMGEPDEDSIFYGGGREEVAKYYYKQRNNRYFGIYYPFSSYRDGIRGGVGIEIFNKIYFGIRINREQRGNAKLHQKFKQLFKSKYFAECSTWWPVWKYSEHSIDFKNLDRKALPILASDEQRKVMAKAIVDQAFEIWQDVTDAIDEGKINY